MTLRSIALAVAVVALWVPASAQTPTARCTVTSVTNVSAGHRVIVTCPTGSQSGLKAGQVIDVVPATIVPPPPPPPPPPTPVACVGTWGSRTAIATPVCSSDGTRTVTYQETFTVTTPAANGGALCSATHGQTRTIDVLETCTVDPPPSGATLGRIFGDGFDNGAPVGWTANNCTVVTAAADGGVPQSGSHMLRCNWAQFNDQEIHLAAWNYNREFLLRQHFRYDQNVDSKMGSKHMRIGFQEPGEILFACQMEQGNAATMLIAPNNQATFWGAPNGPCGDRRWHEMEVYIRDAVNGAGGIIRVWIDGVMIREWVGNTGGHRQNLYIPSNWASNPGWEHDTLNHVYFDSIEIISDRGTGGTGSLADGTAR